MKRVRGFPRNPCFGCIEFLSPGQGFLRISYRHPPLRLLFTSLHSPTFLLPPFASWYVLVRLCKLWSAIRTFLCGSEGLRIAAALQSFLSQARYRNNSVCQVARKYTQRLYDRGEIRFAVPSTTSVPGGIAANNISRRFANLEASSDYSFASIPSDSFGLRFELRIL